MLVAECASCNYRTCTIMYLFITFAGTSIIIVERFLQQVPPPRSAPVLIIVCFMFDYLFAFLFVCLFGCLSRLWHSLLLVLGLSCLYRSNFSFLSVVTPTSGD